MFALPPSRRHVNYAPVLSADELLAMLDQRGISRAEIGRKLGIPASRVSEMYTGKRRLQLDEAKRLVESYQLEEQTAPLNEPIARLLVLYAAEELGARVRPEDDRVGELAKAFLAFSRFATDPQVRTSEAAVEGFFRGYRLAQGQAGAG